MGSRSRWRARYRALGEIAREADADLIATAHTRDDQVETLLMRLLRGAGRRGLGGMRPLRGRLLRPLLHATRADVRRHQRLRTVLEGAYTRLHQRLHAAGAYHRHPLHDPAEPHEH